VLWVREVAKVMLIKDRPVALIVCEDVTERKRVSDALREVEIESAHANRIATIGQLTASVCANYLVVVSTVGYCTLV
jgi:hypothetical protein